MLSAAQIFSAAAAFVAAQLNNNSSPTCLGPAQLHLHLCLGILSGLKLSGWWPMAFLVGQSHSQSAPCAAVHGSAAGTSTGSVLLSMLERKHMPLAVMRWLTGFRITFGLTLNLLHIISPCTMIKVRVCSAGCKQHMCSAADTNQCDQCASIYDQCAFMYIHLAHCGTALRQCNACHGPEGLFIANNV